MESVDHTKRTEAYGRVMKTLKELGPTKLLPGEQERIRDAADNLVFATDLDQARDSLLDMNSLAEHLLKSGRWLEESVDRLIDDLLTCGPVASMRAAA